MFTLEYWKEKADTIMEYDNPELYRKLKKNGKLDQTLTELAEMSLKRAESLYDYLKKNHLPQDNTVEEINTTEFENETAARDITDQELVEMIMSM